MNARETCAHTRMYALRRFSCTYRQTEQRSTHKTHAHACIMHVEVLFNCGYAISTHDRLACIKMKTCNGAKYTYPLAPEYQDQDIHFCAIHRSTCNKLMRKILSKTDELKLHLDSSNKRITHCPAPPDGIVKKLQSKNKHSVSNRTLSHSTALPERIVKKLLRGKRMAQCQAQENHTHHCKPAATSRVQPQEGRSVQLEHEGNDQHIRSRGGTCHVLVSRPKAQIQASGQGRRTGSRQHLTPNISSFKSCASPATQTT